MRARSSSSSGKVGSSPSPSPSSSPGPSPPSPSPSSSPGPGVGMSKPLSPSGVVASPPGPPAIDPVGPMSRPLNSPQVLSTYCRTRAKSARSRTCSRMRWFSGCSRRTSHISSGIRIVRTSALAICGRMQSVPMTMTAEPKPRNIPLLSI
ncbi:MAG: hypothetical protein C0427_15890 [Rhodobacter sp.]|nr:hypothetical protein [Rhodobacter sp.]